MSEMEKIQELVEKESQFVDKLLSEVSKVIVGQRRMMERIMIGLLCKGHILLEGVPGLAKTLTIKTFCDSIKVKFQRLQFTPDLLPADIIGTLIYDQRTGNFIPKKGPIFANLILADEINRAPAKVQSALLEAMQERQVTIGEGTYKLEEPFLVLATQNPIEQEGTYPLPEAQVDRFMLKVLVGYPKKDEEKEIMERMTGTQALSAQPVLTSQELLSAREIIKSIYIDPKIKDYILELVFASRSPEQYGLKDLQALISWGASPRASIYLNLASRAHAFLRHRGYVTPEDVKALAPDVLRHRILLSYEAEAEEIKSDDVIKQILEKIEVP